MRLACAALALLALGACTCSPTCSVGQCYGCCDSVGFCRDGVQNTQCGSGGATCEVCAAGASCVSGTCTKTRLEPDGGRCAETVCMRGTTCDESDGVCRCAGVTCGADAFCDAGRCEGARSDAGPIPCNVATCRGCCLTPDTCHAGNTASACGFNGQVCQPCPLPGVCPNGFCSGVSDAGACGPQTGCMGCCAGGFCTAGDNPIACGSFGQPCQSCGNGVCVIDGGGGFRCIACSAATCPRGCCSNGVCIELQSDTACGRFGTFCRDCQQGHCDADAGLCVLPCAFSCSGCCIGETCVPVGLQDAGTCGVLGQACHGCGAVGRCESGTCVNPDGGSCSIMSCGGCCEGAECRAAPVDSACGLGGGTCEACDAGMTCQFGRCGFAGPDAGSCGPSTCGGAGFCCSGGRCGSTGTSTFCGSNGAACQPCDVGQACFSGACRGYLVGAPCDAGGCAPSLACRTDYPGGYCTAPCVVSGNCPGDAVCAPTDAGAECRQRCGSVGPCRAGYQCVGGDGGFCEPL